MSLIKKFKCRIKKNDQGIKDNSQNPYVALNAGQRLWNDRYFNLAEERRLWQYAFVGAVIMALVLAIGLIQLSLRSEIRPFVIETNQGIPYNVQALKELSAKDPLLMNYLINQFVVNAKSVVSDSSAEEALLHKAYAFSAGAAISELHDYFEQQDPYKIAGQHTVSVSIINSMPVGKNTWQMVWDETTLSLAGQKLKTQRWMGQFEYAYGKINPDFVHENPFGFYITHVSWSPSQQSSEKN